MNELAPNAVWVHEHTADVKIKLIRGHTNAITGCQFIDNDSKIFTCSNDNTTRIWDTYNGSELAKFGDLHGGNISTARVNQENNKFITCSWDKTVKCWDIETGKLLWKNNHNTFVTCCGFSHDNNSKYSVSVSDIDFAIKIWDTHNGKLINEITDLHKNTITSCKFLPKYDRLVTTSMDKTSKFYDLVSNKTTLCLGGHTNVISNCSFTEDERTFVTSSWDKTVLIWDIATGMYRKKGPVVLNKGHEGSISSCCLSSDGTLCVSGGYDLRVVLWDMNYTTAKLILRGHSDWITDVAISNDNKWILTVSKDKDIRLWGVENCDNIKVVAEQNRNLGNKIVKCANCLKPFSITKFDHSPLTSHSGTNLCVFCRLQEQTIKQRNRIENQSEHENSEENIHVTQ